MNTLHRPSVERQRRKKGPLEIAELILKHDPDASMDMIANVLSEWGHFWPELDTVPTRK
jgi:hypothetical protein